jgi:hypothetical protein
MPLEDKAGTVTPDAMTGIRAHVSSGWPMVLIVICMATRILASWLNFVMPDMESRYIHAAQAVFDGTSAAGSTLPIAYGSALYGMNVVLHNWLLSTHVLFVLCSTGAAVLTYLLVRAIYSESVAVRALILSILLPLFSAAVVGYSHTIVVGYCLVLATILAFWQLCQGKSQLLWSIICAVVGGFAMLIRTEYLVLWPLLLCVWLWHRRGIARPEARFALAAAMTMVVFGMLLAVSRAQHAVAPDEPIGLLGNARYSYHTFLHTLSLRTSGTIEDEAAIVLGERAFGPEQLIGYSIPRAIMMNPKVVAANVAFNIQSLLKWAGHPLFMPVFLLPLVGIGLVGRAPAAKRSGWLLLAAVIPPALIHNLLFHVEIRYMMPLSLPLIVLTAKGLDVAAEERPWVPWAVYAALMCLLVAYLFVVIHRAGAPQI